MHRNMAEPAQAFFSSPNPAPPNAGAAMPSPAAGVPEPDAGDVAGSGHTVLVTIDGHHFRIPTAALARSEGLMAGLTGSAAGRAYGPVLGAPVYVDTCAAEMRHICNYLLYGTAALPAANTAEAATLLAVAEAKGLTDVRVALEGARQLVPSPAAAVTSAPSAALRDDLWHPAFRFIPESRRHYTQELYANFLAQVRLAVTNVAGDGNVTVDIMHTDIHRYCDLNGEDELPVTLLPPGEHPETGATPVAEAAAVRDAFLELTVRLMDCGATDMKSYAYAKDSKSDCYVMIRLSFVANEQVQQTLRVRQTA